MEVGKCAFEVHTGTIETKGAHTTRDMLKNDQGGVYGHRRLTIVNVAATHAKVDVKQQRFRALLHDVNPVNVEIWRDRGPERWTGVSDEPP